MLFLLLLLLLPSFASTTTAAAVPQHNDSILAGGCDGGVLVRFVVRDQGMLVPLFRSGRLTAGGTKATTRRTLIGVTCVVVPAADPILGGRRRDDAGVVVKFVFLDEGMLVLVFRFYRLTAAGETRWMPIGLGTAANVSRGALLAVPVDSGNRSSLFPFSDWEIAHEDHAEKKGGSEPARPSQIQPASASGDGSIGSGDENVEVEEAETLGAAAAQPYGYQSLSSPIGEDRNRIDSKFSSRDACSVVEHSPSDDGGGGGVA